MARGDREAFIAAREINSSRVLSVKRNASAAEPATSAKPYSLEVIVRKAGESVFRLSLPPLNLFGLNDGSN